MSVRIAYLFPSITRPIATPATGAFNGTPASIIAKAPPQTVAIDDDPFDSVMSETIRIVYGNVVSSGSTASSARRARAPWPISRRPGLPKRPVSPTEYGGKLEFCAEHPAAAHPLPHAT